jgi:FtsH-binding integral membrane protein
MAAKRHLLHSLHHLITAAALIIKGVDKISHHAFIGSLILLFGVLILSFFFYTLFKKQQSQNLELMVRWFEALVALCIAYIFFTEGKTLIQYVFLLAAVGFFISIYMFHRKKKELAGKQG